MVLQLKLTDEDKQRIKDKNLEILLHPDSQKKEQDINCPKILWQGLGHGSGIGNWCCVLNSQKYGDVLYGGGQENSEILPCDYSDFQNCPRLEKYILSIK